MVDARAKGARREREALALLQELIGRELSRNLAQAREGGADCIDLPGWAIEVKGSERFLSRWFDQAKMQAKPDELPAVMWKQNRRPWRVFVELTPEQFAELVDWQQEEK